MVKPRLEQAQIIVIWEATSWVSVPQSSVPCGESARVKLVFQQWYTKEMRMVPYNVHDIAGVNRED